MDTMVQFIANFLTIDAPVMLVLAIIVHINEAYQAKNTPKFQQILFSIVLWALVASMVLALIGLLILTVAAISQLF